jgi:hypothetical protein
MSLLEWIQKQPKKKKHIIVSVLSALGLLIIILIGVFAYSAPYKKSVRREYPLHKEWSFKRVFSNANQNANSFVEPVDDFFIQQNGEISSEN